MHGGIQRMRSAVAVLASLAVVAALAGCGRQADDSSNNESVGKTTIDSKPAKGELTIWAMGAEGDKLPSLIKDFEKDNPDVHIKVTSIPWSSTHDKLQTSIAACQEPDVAQMGNTFMAEFGNAFDEVPANLDLSDLAPGAVDGAKVKGKQLGVPWYIDTRVLFYRTDIARKAGWDHGPRTWDELRRMAQDMQKQDGVQYGMYIGPSGTDNFGGLSPFIFSEGGNLCNEDCSKWTIDTPEAHKAITFTSNLFKDKIADANADVSPGADIASFASGKTPMMMQGPTGIGQVEQVGGKDITNKFATSPIPKDKSAISYSGGCEMVVFKNSKNKNAAWKLVQWLSKPKVQAKWYKLSTDLPASEKAWEDPILKGDDKLAAFATQMKNMRSVPAVTTWTQVSSQGDKIMEEINKGAVSVDEGLSKLQSAADAAGMGK